MNFLLLLFRDYDRKPFKVMVIYIF